MKSFENEIELQKEVGLQQRAERLGEKTFLGVPTHKFASGGREHLIYLLAAGLNPDSKVAELGCGVLRLGYWLIHFLEPSCYCGIEPHTGRLAMGVETILGRDIVEAKKPRFDTNSMFDTSVFGERFDVFVAYSIWTHASKKQIGMMLDSFVRDATEHAIFMTSYLPAGEGRPDYQGDTWVGTSHESDIPGIIHHDVAWIEAQCVARGLVACKLGEDKSYAQCWLAIHRSGAGDRALAPLLNLDEPARPAGTRWPWRVSRYA